MTKTRAALLAIGLLLGPSSAFAEDSVVRDEKGARRLIPTRQEIIILPDIGGTSDVGFEIGVAASTTRFVPGYTPYRWRLDLLASLSFKNDARGFRVVEHDYNARLDVPHFVTERLRLDSRISFNRYVTARWYGIGNRTIVEELPPPPEASTTHDYVHEEAHLRNVLRVKLVPILDLAFAGHFRISAPTVFPTSRLQRDLDAGEVVGGKTSFIETLGTGVYVDTRDNEFVTREGLYYQLGVAETVGTQERVSYGEASMVLAHYARLVGQFSFASRFVGSFKFGRVPFEEQQQGGVFVPQYLVGGEDGVRGVVLGRFAGLVKLVSNFEIRATPYPSFKIFNYRMRIGQTAFVDVGRVFADYRNDPVRDGRNLGLKVGLGGGIIFQFDESLVFLVEAAYSQTNTAKLPLSIYLGSGMHF